MNADDIYYEIEKHGVIFKGSKNYIIAKDENGLFIQDISENEKRHIETMELQNLDINAPIIIECSQERVTAKKNVFPKVTVTTEVVLMEKTSPIVIYPEAAIISE